MKTTLQLNKLLRLLNDLQTFSYVMARSIIETENINLLKFSLISKSRIILMKLEELILHTIVMRFVLVTIVTVVYCSFINYNQFVLLNTHYK